MVTLTEEPQQEVKTLDFDFVQNRVNQVRDDILAADQAAKDEEDRYRQIPDDETGKLARAKASEAIRKLRNSTSTYRKELSFDEIVILLDGYMTKGQEIRKEFETIRDHVEKLVCDIAVAEKKATDSLSEYRTFLHNGEKVKADKALDSISKHRKKSKRLRTEISKLSKADELKLRIETLRLQISALIETGSLLDLQQRLQNALSMPGMVQNNCGNTLSDITKLEKYITKQM